MQDIAFRGSGMPSLVTEDSAALAGAMLGDTRDLKRRTPQHSELWTMATSRPGQWVVPNPKIPRTFGWLNIVFGVILLLAGFYAVAMFFLAPRVAQRMQDMFQSTLTFQKGKVDVKIAELKEQEEKAKTEAEKKELQDRRAAIAAAPLPPIDMFEDMKKWNIYNDRRVAVYFWLEVSAAIVLNVLMIIAGVGLLRAAEWARQLSVGVSWLKIVRRIAIVIVTMVLILPITTAKIRELYAKMDAQIASRGGGRPAPISFTAMAPLVGMATAVGSVFEGIVAAIYPALSVWYLTRPRARAACLAPIPSKLPVPENEPGATW
jgi:hypothetical protein